MRGLSISLDARRDRIVHMGYMGILQNSIWHDNDGPFCVLVCVYGYINLWPFCVLVANYINVYRFIIYVK